MKPTKGANQVNTPRPPETEVEALVEQALQDLRNLPKQDRELIHQLFPPRSALAGMSEEEREGVIDAITWQVVEAMNRAYSRIGHMPPWRDVIQGVIDAAGFQQAQP
jgi:hypothetical protein